MKINKSYKLWTIKCKPIINDSSNWLNNRNRYNVFYDNEVNKGVGKSTFSFTPKCKDWGKYD
jgi:hypothetical protein